MRDVDEADERGGGPIDGALLEQARRVVGGTTSTQTIESALASVIMQREREAAVRREHRRWSSGRYAELVRFGHRSAPSDERPADQAGEAPVVAGWLLHSSALGCTAHQAVARRVSMLTASQLLHTCAVTELQVLSIARSPAEYRALLEDRRLIYQPALLTDEVCDQALALHARVAEHGRQDIDASLLLVAACARVHGLTVLHHHDAFDLLGALCGLSHESCPTAAPGLERPFGEV